MILNAPRFYQLEFVCSVESYLANEFLKLDRVNIIIHGSWHFVIYLSISTTLNHGLEIHSENKLLFLVFVALKMWKIFVGAEIFSLTHI